jgi:hypothetical protein
MLTFAAQLKPIITRRIKEGGFFVAVLSIFLRVVVAEQGLGDFLGITDYRAAP